MSRSKPSSPGRSGNGPLDTVKLNNRDRQHLMSKINSSGSSMKWQSERRATRIVFDVPRILFTLIQPTGNQVRHAAVPRNISKRGIAFILGQFVYPDSECKVAVPTLSGEWVAIGGVVRRCRHIDGVHHEVSVVFEETIDLREFVSMSRDQEDQVRDELAEDLGEAMADSDGFSEQILIVDDDKANRKLLNHWVSHLGMRAREATTATQVTKLIKEETIDLIILDMSLGEAEGIELVQTVRGRGFTSPIIAASTDDNESLRERCTQAGCNGFLIKPYTIDEIRNILEKALVRSLEDEVSDPIHSSFKDDENMRPLLQDFVKMLTGTTSKLNEANNRSDYELIERVCRQLKGAGGSYGYGVITDVSEMVLAKLTAEQVEFESIHESVCELIQTLRRVQA